MRLVLGLSLAPLLISSFCVQAQVNSSQPTATSDPQAVSLAAQSLAAMTGGTIITDVTLTGDVGWFLGTDQETGTGTWVGKVGGKSRIDLSLDQGKKTEIRTASTDGIPAGAWIGNDGKSHAFAQHNCWTDAAWFFPVLSSLSQGKASTFVFSYVGQEDHNGVPSHHLRVYQALPQFAFTPSRQPLNVMDFYLDASSLLPLAVAFTVHADTDVNTDIPAEIRFAKYQSISGVQMPFHIQRLLNGSLLLDFTVTSAAFNTGVSDTIFSLQ